MGSPDIRDDSPNVFADELSEALEGMAPAGVTAGVRPISTVDVDRLSPPERALTITMSPKRLAEFASGRLLLHALTGTVDPILRAASGAPSFQPGASAHWRTTGTTLSRS